MSVRRQSMIEASSADDAQKPGVLYNSIRDKMKTGDTLLFRGHGVVSDAILNIEKYYDGIDAFSHAGMVVWAKDLPAVSSVRRPGDNDSVYVLESTASGSWTDGVPSIMDGKGHIGVQLRNLDLVVEAYDANPETRLAWLPLQERMKPIISQQQIDATITRYLNTSYDGNCLDLSAAAVPFMRFVRDNRCVRHFRNFMYHIFCCGAHPDTWLFCSELVAQIYVDWEIFPTTVIPADVMPTDFLPANFESSKETTGLLKTETADSDHQVPWVFVNVTRFHC